MIGAMSAPLENEVATPPHSTEVLPLEYCFSARPVGRLMIIGQVPTLDPFRALPPDARLWMRWVEPPDLDDAQIENAAQTSRDERPCTARVLARAAMPDRMGAWALYRLAEVQGLVDLLPAGSGAPDGSPQEYLSLLVCADLSQRSSDLGLPDRMGAWALYRLAEVQGLVDLLPAGSGAPDGSPQEYLSLLVCADLSQRSSDLGLSVDPFSHYR